ncbi:MAG TPA: HAMP domain-containing sensor histidine kinase [Gammaproteobacteria bacterium]|nr:HAMP domain-containing sensor histidine kinase [Gammaproteobacteria bacterium]
MSSTTRELAELANPDAYTWRPLRILSIYRVVIVAAIALAFLGAQNMAWMKAEIRAALFFDVTLAYLTLSLLAYTLTFQKRLGFSWQVYGQALIDVCAIALLIFAAGSLDSGLGMLMVVAIAGLSMLMNMRSALFFAALASILLLLLQVIGHLQTGKPGVGYTQIALLGMTIFITAALSSLLSRRAHHNQALADQRGHDLRSLEALNSFIVQQLQSGVVVVDTNKQVRLLNKASWTLLGRPEHVRNIALRDLSPNLAACLSQWREGQTIPPQPLLPQGPEVVMRFHPLGERGSQGTLMFLENTVETRAAVQQAKLASLGQLSANIAHEIRNPLSAITHAAQLLEESPGLVDGDKRLLAIILNQSARLNTLVQSVLQMSRRHPAQRERFQLSGFLAQLKTELYEQHPHADYQLVIRIAPPDLAVDFDVDHLRQILTNLCQNAISHGSRADVPLTVTLRAYRADDQVVVEVADNGKGIAADAVPHLFEPFFTTASSGTGLGLYLCQELCESNGARLMLIPQQVGACFRIQASNDNNEDE